VFSSKVMFRERTKRVTVCASHAMGGGDVTKSWWLFIPFFVDYVPLCSPETQGSSREWAVNLASVLVVYPTQVNTQV
jgi:hypothetical protein